MTGFIASLYCISLILATITLTYSLNNVIILFNFISIVFILAFSLLVFNFISITLLIIIIYSTLMSILFLVNGILVMYSLSFNYMSLYNDFGLLMNHSLYCFICYIYLYLFESIIYLDSLSTFYLSFPHSFHFVNHCFNGISNLVFDNTLFMFVFLFFIVGMININLLFLVVRLGFHCCIWTGADYPLRSALIVLMVFAFAGFIWLISIWRVVNGRNYMELNIWFFVFIDGCQQFIIW